MRRNTMVGIGLLGAGFVSTFYMKGLAEVPGQRVRAVYGRDPVRTRAFAARWGIAETAHEMRAVVERPDVDLVIIGLPNRLHLEAARVAVEAGKHVVCTKPLARNVEEARAMRDLVRRAGVLH